MPHFSNMGMQHSNIRSKVRRQDKNYSKVFKTSKVFKEYFDKYHIHRELRCSEADCTSTEVFLNQVNLCKH